MIKDEKQKEDGKKEEQTSRWSLVALGRAETKWDAEEHIWWLGDGSGCWGWFYGEFMCREKCWRNEGLWFTMFFFVLSMIRSNVELVNCGFFDWWKKLLHENVDRGFWNYDLILPWRFSPYIIVSSIDTNQSVYYFSMIVFYNHQNYKFNIYSLASIQKIFHEQTIHG